LPKRIFEDYDDLVLGSGDGFEDEMVDEGPVKGPFLVIIIVGSVLLFILLCLVVPCIIECRKCRREGHCCCAMFGSKSEEEDEEYQGQSSLERQKAQMAGYA
jgi:hypothetical protein